MCCEYGCYSLCRYDVVSACWQKNPIDRPHFSIIHDELDELIMSKQVSASRQVYVAFQFTGTSFFAAELPRLEELRWLRLLPIWR